MTCQASVEFLKHVWPRRGTLPKLRLLYVDQAIFDLDAVGGDGIGRRQARHPAAANVEARAVAGALNLVVAHLSLIHI